MSWHFKISSGLAVTLSFEGTIFGAVQLSGKLVLLKEFRHKYALKGNLDSKRMTVIVFNVTPKERGTFLNVVIVEELAFIQFKSTIRVEVDGKPDFVATN